MHWPEGFTPAELRLWMRDIGFPCILVVALLVGFDRVAQAADRRLGSIEDVQRNELQAITRLIERLDHR